MLIALTREVSPTLEQCELTFRDRVPLDVDLARHQHAEYRAALEELGARVVEVPPAPDLPDAVFVEDTAVVLDELAVITRPGADSRRPECASVAEKLAGFRELTWIRAPGTLEGGDVFRVGRTLYVGRSTRTSAAGIGQLRSIVAGHGYRLVEVPVRGCLHLKSACCPLDGSRALVQKRWVEATSLSDLELIDVPHEEPDGANVLAVGARVIVPRCHPRTSELLEECGLGVVSIDLSELAKAESGVTCASVVFRGS